MACTNCFSGCVSTTSDKCVKYTGNAIALLGIETGDTLESVEEKITDYLLTVFTGEGISPVIDPQHLCTIVSDYLPQDPTLVDILTAVIRAICDIEAEIVVERGRIETIEADYTVDCIPVAANAGTHDVLQAVITELCAAVGDISEIYNLLNLYVKTTEINGWIANYLNSISTSNYYYTKMVPYAVYPFYPTAEILGLFSVSGAGQGVWQKVYFCNGENGTPDLRGRSIIGVVSAMQGGVLDDEVASPSTNYIQGDTAGDNRIVLAPNQMAAHTHNAVVDVTDPGHVTHIDVALSGNRAWETKKGGTNDRGQPIVRVADIIGDHSGGTLPDENYTATSTAMDPTGITVAVTNEANTGGVAHDNIHPVYALYYIMHHE